MYIRKQSFEKDLWSQGKEFSSSILNQSIIALYKFEKKNILTPQEGLLEHYESVDNCTI